MILPFLGPWCPDPYELLAMIFEERGESVKSLQYSLLAAHLQVGDVDHWARLAESCEDAGFLQQAAHCYAKGKIFAVHIISEKISLLI